MGLLEPNTVSDYKESFLNIGFKNKIKYPVKDMSSLNSCNFVMCLINRASKVFILSSSMKANHQCVLSDTYNSYWIAQYHLLTTQYLCCTFMFQLSRKYCILL